MDEDLTAMDANGVDRISKIHELRDGIGELLEDMEQCQKGIEEIMGSDILQQPITGDLEGVRKQLDDLRAFKNGLDPLSHRVEGLVNRGQDLIKSAGPSVDTSRLESAMSGLSEAWKELKTRVSEREQKLDGAILGLGNYQDARQSMLNWLEETEELAGNLRDPSSDHKVVKAQIQEQRLVQKLVDDKRPAVEGFAAMVDQIQRLAADEKEAEQLRKEADQIAERYENLCADAEDRRSRLQDALDL